LSPRKRSKHVGRNSVSVLRRLRSRGGTKALVDELTATEPDQPTGFIPGWGASAGVRTKGTTQDTAQRDKRAEIVAALGRYLHTLYEFDQEQPVPERITELVAELGRESPIEPPHQAEL
jgi:hypothetical protein